MIQFAFFFEKNIYPNVKCNDVKRMGPQRDTTDEKEVEEI